MTEIEKSELPKKISISKLEINELRSDIISGLTQNVDNLFKKRLETTSPETRKRYRLIITTNIICLILILAVGITSTIVILSKSKKIIYVNDFPHNLKEITDLINEAEEEIIIATDVTSYGVMSNYKLFHKYSSVITQKLGSKPNLKFEMITLNDTLERDTI